MVLDDRNERACDATYVMCLTASFSLLPPHNRVRSELSDSVLKQFNDVSIIKATIVMMLSVCSRTARNPCVTYFMNSLNGAESILPPRRSSISDESLKGDTSKVAMLPPGTMSKMNPKSA